MSWGPSDVGAQVTRIHVVDHTGRSHEFWADEWAMHFQDNNQTLKLFAKGTGANARQNRSTALGKDLSAGDAYIKARMEEREQTK